jgi:hypothetical protein
LSTRGVSAVIEARVADCAAGASGVGPSGISSQLERDGVVPLPGRPSVLRALIRHGLIDPKKRERRRQDYRRWERGRAMELRQVRYGFGS